MRLLPLTTRLTETLRTRQMDVVVGLYVAIVFAYVCSGNDAKAWIAMTVPFLGLAAISTDSRTVRFGAVLAMAGVMGAMVLANFYVAANHGFVLTWVGLGLAIACACDPPEDEPVLRRVATMLLAILMGFALIQKLREPYYTDGDLLGGLLIEGEIYKNLITLVLPDWPSLVADYGLAFDTLLAVPTPGSVAIAVPVAIVGLAWRMTIGSILAQAALDVMVLFRARLGIWLHLAILGFVLLVYSTRDENEFLSINCLLGYAMTDERTAGMRPWYVVAIIYLLSATLIDLRPWIFS